MQAKSEQSALPSFWMLAGFAWLGLATAALTGADLFWDLRCYHAAGTVWFREGDPYDLAALRAAAAAVPVHHPYVYPPWTLPLAGALSLLPYPVLAASWGLGSGAALAGIGRIAMAGCRSSSHPALVIALLGLGFSSSGWIGLRSGNVEPFIALSVLLALQRPHRTLLLVLAGAAKLQPALLLLLRPLLPGPRPDPKSLGAATALLALALLLPFLTAPLVQDRWLATLTTPFAERGSLSPSLFNFLRSSLGFWGFAGPRSAWVGFGLVTLVLLGIAAGTLRRTKSPIAAARTGLLLATYALLLPRWKDYSAVLLVPAALALAPRAFGPRFVWCAALLAPVPTLASQVDSVALRGVLAYWNLYLLLALWFLALRACAQRPGDDDAGFPRGDAAPP